MEQLPPREEVISAPSEELIDQRDRDPSRIPIFEQLLIDEGMTDHAVLDTNVCLYLGASAYFSGPHSVNNRVRLDKPFMGHPIKAGSAELLHELAEAGKYRQFKPTGCPDPYVSAFDRMVISCEIADQAKFILELERANRYMRALYIDKADIAFDNDDFSFLHHVEVDYLHRPAYILFMQNVTVAAGRNEHLNLELIHVENAYLYTDSVFLKDSTLFREADDALFRYSVTRDTEELRKSNTLSLTNWMRREHEYLGEIREKRLANL